MSTPAIGDPPPAPAPGPTEYRALRAAPAWGVLWLAAATAGVAWWRVAPLPDEAVEATLFVLGAAWWLINAGSRHPRTPGPGVVLVATGIALVAFRLLQVASPVDFWILRLAPPLVLLAVAVVAGGTGAVWPALPGWLALLLWLWWPSLNGLLELDANGRVSSFTARLTGLLLGLAGHATRVEANSIWSQNIRIDVLMPCTCLPLVLALTKTLLPAALLLRITLRRTVVLALLVGPVALAVSVVRCAVLVEVAPQEERFHYWHGPEGASIFTAIALGVIGWGLVAGARAPTWLAQPVPSAAPARASRFALAMIMAAAVFAWWGQPAAPFLAATVNWNPPSGWRVVTHRRRTWPVENTLADKPLTQCDEWVADTPAGQVRFLVGYAPVLLGGAAAQLVYLEGFDPRFVGAVQETVLPGLAQPVATWVGGNGQWWVALAGGDGVARASPADWVEWLRGQRWHPSRWVRLLAGQGPLLDKRALWLAVCWPAPDAGRPAVREATARLMTSGLDMAATLLSTRRQLPLPAP
jgi:hypothetical protein